MQTNPLLSYLTHQYRGGWYSGLVPFCPRISNMQTFRFYEEERIWHSIWPNNSNMNLKSSSKFSQLFQLIIFIVLVTQYPIIARRPSFIALVQNSLSHGGTFCDNSSQYNITIISLTSNGLIKYTTHNFDNFGEK